MSSRVSDRLSFTSHWVPTRFIVPSLFLCVKHVEISLSIFQHFHSYIQSIHRSNIRKSTKMKSSNTGEWIYWNPCISSGCGKRIHSAHPFLCISPYPIFACTDMWSSLRTKPKLYQGTEFWKRMNGEALASNRVEDGNTMPVIDLNHTSSFLEEHLELILLPVITTFIDSSCYFHWCNVQWILFTLLFPIE